MMIADGTTVCVCIIYEDTMYLAHVGDTRAVVISQDQEVHFSTHDHKVYTPSNEWISSPIDRMKRNVLVV